MNEWAGGYSGAPVALDEDLEREFEDRLRESSALAFRVAYGVLRHRQDAEDVAQESFAKAYRSFRQLRDRDRFRAWLVRMTWRLAIDRRRADRRREAREQSSPEGLRYSSEMDVAQGFSPAEEDLLTRERANRLWQALAPLPGKLRV